MNIITPVSTLTPLLQGFDLDSCPLTLTYTGDLVATITATYGTRLFRQTYTYSGNLVTNISGFVEVSS